MKKFIAFLLVFCLAIPQTFAQMNFWPLQPLWWLKGSPSGARQDNNSQLMIFASRWILQTLQSPRRLAIAIGGVGILSAAMYPAITSYKSSSRDVNRQGSLNSLSLTIYYYQVDNNKFPPQIPSWCVPYVYLIIHKYINKNSNYKDPKVWFRHDGCTDANAKAPYAYRVIKKQDKEIVIMSANMESSQKGNSRYSAEEIAKNPALIDQVNTVKWKYFVVVID